MKAHLRIVTIVLITGLTGCASVPDVPVVQLKGDILHGQSLGYAIYPSPEFEAVTATRMMTSPFSNSASFKAGDELVLQESLSDPSAEVSRALRQALADKYQAQPAPTLGQMVSDDSPATLAQAYPGVRYVLSVVTLQWALHPFINDMYSVQVSYMARLRLVDTQQHTVVAQGRCYAELPDSTSDAPTYNDALDNHAERLKQMIKLDVDACTKDFETRVFNIAP